jgi:hypothetical protein
VRVRARPSRARPSINNYNKMSRIENGETKISGDNKRRGAGRGPRLPRLQRDYFNLNKWSGGRHLCPRPVLFMPGLEKRTCASVSSDARSPLSLSPLSLSSLSLCCWCCCCCTISYARARPRLLSRQCFPGCTPRTCPRLFFSLIQATPPFLCRPLRTATVFSLIIARLFLRETGNPVLQIYGSVIFKKNTRTSADRR